MKKTYLSFFIQISCTQTNLIINAHKEADVIDANLSDYKINSLLNVSVSYCISAV